MHKLIDYVCDELKELERKAEKNGSLSMSEIQYMDTLAHAKKNLLTGEAMMKAEEEGESGYYMPSNGYYGRSYAGDSRVVNTGRSSYARGRDRMGRYTSRRGSMSYDDGMVEELRDLMEQAPDESTKRDFKRLIDKIEQM